MIFARAGQTCLIQEPRAIKLRSFRAAKHEVENSHIHISNVHVLLKQLYKLKKGMCAILYIGILILFFYWFSNLKVHIYNTYI